MQPLYSPPVPEFVVAASMVAVVAFVAVVAVTRGTSSVRMGAVALLLLLSTSGRAHAAPLVTIAPFATAAQYVMDPCGLMEPGWWLWYVTGCFLR